MNDNHRLNSDIYSNPVTDGLTNVISGLGTSKSRNPSSFLNRGPILGRIELEDIYRHYWIAKAVDIRPWDMTREWRRFEAGDITPEQIKSIEDLEKKIGLPEKVREALKWASLYGGAGIIMHFKGSLGSMEEELNPERVGKGDLERLSVGDRWELIEATPIDYNPLSPTYRTAEYYYLANDVNHNRIHRSRIIFFRGREMPIRVTRQLKGYGESDVQRWYQAMINNETLSAAIIEGVHQSNIDVVGVKGLANLLATDDGEEKAKNRFMVMDYCKSLLNMSIIDAEDNFTRNAFPFSGLPDIKRIFLEILSSATDIPLTRFLGSSPSGLNSTGEGDIRNYYDSIGSEQQAKLSPKLDMIDQVLIRSAIGSYPEDISYEFNSLWQMSPNEEADLKLKQVQILQGLHDLGVDEFVLQRDAIEKGLVINLTTEDIDSAEKNDDFDFDDEEGVVERE
jgi:phage-related protein (TIGR01555 family)